MSDHEVGALLVIGGVVNGIIFCAIAAWLYRISMRWSEEVKMGPGSPSDFSGSGTTQPRYDRGPVASTSHAAALICAMVGFGSLFIAGLYALLLVPEAIRLASRTSSSWVPIVLVLGAIVAGVGLVAFVIAFVRDLQRGPR